MTIYTLKFVESGRESFSAFRTREEAERLRALLAEDAVEVDVIEHHLHP